MPYHVDDYWDRPQPDEPPLDVSAIPSRGMPEPRPPVLRRRRATRPPRRHRNGRLWGAVGTLGLVLALPVIALSQLDTIDSFVSTVVRPPAPDVVALADRVAFTEEARTLFYGTYPELHEGAAAFDQACPVSGEAGWTVLGCWDGQLIHVRTIADPTFDGANEVTAAHELLHAAWDDLDGTEQARLEPLLEAEAAARAGDPRFQARLDSYARNQPGTRATELHSILGTEHTPLSPELEAHYATYFTDRQVILGLYAQSVGRAHALEARIAALDAELDAITAVNGPGPVWSDGDAVQRYNTLVDERNAIADEHNALQGAWEAAVRG